MSHAEPLAVDLVLATRGHVDARNGAITLAGTVPLWAWMDVLTHKRLARNATSAKYMSVKRYAAKGYYVPPVFLNDDGVPVANQDAARLFWESCQAEAAQWAATAHRMYGIGRRQANRLNTLAIIMRGVWTGTEDAWARVLDLRDHPAADDAVQLWAAQVRDVIAAADWQIAPSHVPYGPPELTDDEQRRAAMARLARTSSGRPGPGQRSDEELTTQLVAERHGSPGEHILSWQYNPQPSAICSKPADLHDGYGWATFRDQLEGAYS